MSHLEITFIYFQHMKGYCWVKEVNTDVVLDVYKYINSDLADFSWEVSFRTCMVCLSDCSEEAS